MKDIYYVNSAGERLNLLAPPYMLQTGDIFNYEWEYTSSGDGKITGFRKNGVYKKNLVLSILNLGKEKFYEAIDHFFETVEYDILQECPGKLYFGDVYLKCYMTESKKSEWEPEALVDCEYVIVTDYPFWISETTYNFYSYDTILSSNNKNYPGRYPYRYANGLSNAYIQNPHFTNSNFDLIIYGPVVNPQVTIGEIPYLVNIVLETGEYLKIDSRAGTVTKVMANGEIVNAFHNRQKGRQFFKKIPPGRHSVSWPGTFAWDIIIYEERSEPKWNVSQQQ